MRGTDSKIRFRGYLTFADSLKVQKAVGRRRRVSPFLVITVVTLAATAYLVHRMQVNVAFGIFLLVFMGAFMYGGLRLMRTAAAKTQQQVYEKACSKRTGTLTEAGITIRKNKALRSIPWTAFDRAVALEGVVALIRETDTLGFAKYMFDTEQDWDRASDLILSRYADLGASRDR